MKLTLKKETVVELTAEELGAVAGGAITLKGCEPTLSMTCGSEIDRCFTAWRCTTTV